VLVRRRQGQEILKLSLFFYPFNVFNWIGSVQINLCIPQRIFYFYFALTSSYDSRLYTPLRETKHFLSKLKSNRRSSKFSCNFSTIHDRTRRRERQRENKRQDKWKRTHHVKRYSTMHFATSSTRQLFFSSPASSFFEARVSNGRSYRDSNPKLSPDHLCLVNFDHMLDRE
jgi:hypothetical protein